jgi:hypothetical protein
MRTLKALIFASLCTITISTVAQSDVPSQTNTPQQRTNYIKQHVSDVTSDQESKILSIEQQCSTAMQSTTNNKAKDSILRSSDSQIKAVLTPDQYTQYEKIKKNLPKENTGSY